MSKTWTVIAITLGDGSVDYGQRIWSQTFASMGEADEAAKFILAKAKFASVKIIEPIT